MRGRLMIIAAALTSLSGAAWAANPAGSFAVIPSTGGAYTPSAPLPPPMMLLPPSMPGGSTSAAPREDSPPPQAQPPAAAAPVAQPLAFALPNPSPAAPTAALSVAGRKTISLDLRDMDIVEVLKIISRQSGMNVVVGKNVAGKVTVFLNNVDFWEALRTILETRDLAFVKEGDLVRIITAADYERAYGETFGEKRETRSFPFKYIKAKSARDVLDPMKSKVGTLVVNEITNTLIVEDTPDHLAQVEDMIKTLDVPVETRTFVLSYAAVDDILPKVQPLVSREYGSIQTDKRSNSLVVTDNPARLAEISGMIKTFDARNKAVLIEAKIVQVILNDEFQWGINWSRAFRAQRDASSPAYAGSVTGNSQLLPLASVSQNPATGQIITVPGITANITSLTGLQISGAMNFLQTAGKTKVLSSPRVVSLNNQEAKILVGTKEAYVTTTVLTPGSGGVTSTSEQVNFVDVGVKLYVTPTIGDDGFLTLKIKPEVSSVDSVLRTAEGNTIPIVRISQAETSLVVKDGVTVVIGGLMEDTKSSDKSGIPILSKIPILGLPFRSQDDKTKKTELVIFITPHITTGESSSPEAEVYLPQKDWPQDLPKPKRGFFQRLFGMNKDKKDVPG